MGQADDPKHAYNRASQNYLPLVRDGRNGAEKLFRRVSHNLSTPHRFRRSRRKQTGRARRAFTPGAAGDRLMSALGDSAYLFRVSPADLGLSLEREHPSALYGPEAMKEIYRAVGECFSGPLYCVAEVGEGDLQTPGRGRLHLHVIAHRESGPQHIRRDTERCKPVTDPMGLYRYLAKPPEPYSLEAELDLAAARALSETGKAPRTRRHFLGPDRMAWPSLHCSIEPNAPETSPNPPSSAQDPARETALPSQLPGRLAGRSPDPLFDPAFPPLDPARANAEADQATRYPRSRSSAVRTIPIAGFSYAVRSARPATPHHLVRILAPPLSARIRAQLRRWIERFAKRPMLKSLRLRLGANKPTLLDSRTVYPRGLQNLSLLTLRRARNYPWTR